MPVFEPEIFLEESEGEKFVAKQPPVSQSGEVKPSTFSNLLLSLHKEYDQVRVAYEDLRRENRALLGRLAGVDDDSFAESVGLDSEATEERSFDAAPVTKRTFPLGEDPSKLKLLHSAIGRMVGPHLRGQAKSPAGPASAAPQSAAAARPQELHRQTSPSDAPPPPLSMSVVALPAVPPGASSGCRLRAASEALRVLSDTTHNGGDDGGGSGGEQGEPSEENENSISGQSVPSRRAARRPPAISTGVMESSGTIDDLIRRSPLSAQQFASNGGVVRVRRASRDKGQRKLVKQEAGQVDSPDGGNNPKASDESADISAIFQQQRKRSRKLDLQDVELWSSWTAASTAPTPRESVQNQTSSVTQVFTNMQVLRGGDELMDDSCIQHLVLGPSSTLRMFWDLLSVLVVSYDVLMVPLSVFEHVSNSSLVRELNLSTTFFWTIDMLLSFMTGYYDGGLVEMRPLMIAKHYIRSWFMMDLVVVTTDWVLILLRLKASEFVGVVRITKTLRLGRIMRLLRLVRMMKLPNLCEGLLVIANSETISTFGSITRNIILISVVNHFIACGWIALADWSGDELPSWTKSLLLDPTHQTDLFRYFTALHWSFTQFTPASMEVHAVNIYERVYSVIVLLTALVTFSTFVSSITTSMTTLRRINAEKALQHDMIRRYVTENQLSIELGNKISFFVKSHRVLKRRRVHEDDVQVFSVLPETTLLQLHWEVYAEKVLAHPLFNHLREVNEGCLVEICHKAMSEISIATGQELFVVGQFAEKVYFLQDGLLRFHHWKGTMKFDPNEVENERSHIWFCEVALWIKWEHEGLLAALTRSELVALDAAKVRRIIPRFHEVFGACKEYAKWFQQRMLVEKADNSGDDLWDVWCCLDEVFENSASAFGIVSNMQATPQDSHDHGTGSIMRHVAAWGSELARGPFRSRRRRGSVFRNEHPSMGM